MGIVTAVVWSGGIKRFLIFLTIYVQVSLEKKRQYLLFFPFILIAKLFFYIFLFHIITYTRIIFIPLAFV